MTFTTRDERLIFEKKKARFSLFMCETFSVCRVYIYLYSSRRNMIELHLEFLRKRMRAFLFISGTLSLQLKNNYVTEKTRPLLLDTSRDLLLWSGLRRNKTC